MTDLVTIDIHEGVADVRLNRPDKYNALSQDMFNAVIGASAQLAENRSVRAVVLSGNGPGFCAGLDVSSFAGMADREPSDASSLVKPTGDATRPENRAQQPAMGFKRLPVPVIAAMHGVAYGGGLQIALGADMRYAAPDARLSILEIKWGLIPDMAITQTIRDILPQDVVKELTFTGRILSGTEAHEIGLVTRVCEDPLAAALETAAEIANKNPDAIRHGKRLLEEAWHADPATGLHLEASMQAELIGSPNQTEAVKASFEKRAPKFEDPAA